MRMCDCLLCILAIDYGVIYALRVNKPKLPKKGEMLIYTSAYVEFIVQEY